MIYAKKNGRAEIQGTPLCRLVTPAGLEQIRRRILVTSVVS